MWKGGMSFHGGFLGCVLAVVLFARNRGLSILSLGDITCAVGPIGIFLGRIANFINGELWGRPADVPWAMVFPGGGPLPRHPSQLYEATLEGLVLVTVLFLLMRAGALKRPGLIIGSFAVVYAIARTVSESSRARRPARLPVGRRHHGPVAVAAAVPRRRLLHRLRAPASTCARMIPKSGHRFSDKIMRIQEQNQ